VAITQWLREAGRVLVDLFYPPRCVGCGQGGSLYCRACRDSVRLVVPPICPLCGAPQDRRALCARCGDCPLLVDGIRSTALFEGTLREAIHQFKYGYVRDLAAPLADLLIAGFPEIPVRADVIVPVPLHRRRLKERGYNQALLLAERLGEAVGVPIAHDLLYRNRHTMSQARLNAQERRRNVEDAFSCADRSVQDKRVLLVDDVCTTGATLEACSVALKERGALSVWALTVARPS
jgi:ComF family protein